MTFLSLTLIGWKEYRHVDQPSSLGRWRRQYLVYLNEAARRCMSEGCSLDVARMQPKLE